MKLKWLWRKWCVERTPVVPDARFWRALYVVERYLWQITECKSGSEPDQLPAHVFDSICTVGDWITIAVDEDWFEDAPPQS